MNRGAKGIALIDDSGHKPALRYVFDVSDTNTRYNIPFRLWQTKSQYTAQIIEELQNHFGDTGVENANIAATVLGISINAVSDNYRDYYEELLKAADNSALADMSDDEITWKAVARRLRELIAIDRYLTEKEKAYLPEYEAKEAERRLQLAEEAAAREALRAAAAAMDERRKDAQYSFSLGDTVQLGATTYVSAPAIEGRNNKKLREYIGVLKKEVYE